MLELFGNKYPYTDFHELNLDWLISKVLQLNSKLDDFVTLNTIKYADPIGWDITRQYATNTVVIEQSTGIAYISSRPVPAGVSISDTNYWSVIFDLQQIIGSINENITYHNDGTSPTCTFTLNVGDWVLWNSKLYKVLQPMSPGYAYVVDSNIEAHSVEELVKELITAIYVYIGELTNLTTTDKTSIVNAINDVNASCVVLSGLITSLTNVVGDLADLTTTDKTSIVNAINDVNASCATIITTIGDLADLTTTDKTSVVNAINDVNASCVTILGIIGDLNDLITTDKTSIVNAINEAVDRINQAQYQDYMAFKRILLQGDSYAVENADGSWALDVYNSINDTTGLKVYKLATGGAGFVGATGGYTFLQALQAYMSGSPINTPGTITDIYIMGGYNDISATHSDLVTAVCAYADYCKSVFPIAMVHVGCIGWGRRGDNASIAKVVIPAYMQACTMRDNLDYLSRSEFLNHDLGNINPSPDYIHPNPTANAFIAGQLFNVIKGGQIDVFRDSLVSIFNPVADDNGVPAVPAGNSWHSTIHNDVTDITVNSLNIAWSNGLSGFSGSAYTGNFKKIGDLENGCVAGYYEDGEFSIMIPVTAWLSFVGATTTFYLVNGWLCIANGGVFFGYSYISGGAPVAGSIYQVIFTPFRYSVPSIKA